jgi:hypothetical protein
MDLRAKPLERITMQREQNIGAPVSYYSASYVCLGHDMAIEAFSSLSTRYQHYVVQHYVVQHYVVQHYVVQHYVVSCGGILDPRTNYLAPPIQP